MHLVDLKVESLVGGLAAMLAVLMGHWWEKLLVAWLE
jgi:hypothetical protein